MSRKHVALLAIVTAALLWSTAGISSKFLLRYFTPLSLTFLRFLIASLTITPFFLRKNAPGRTIRFHILLPVALLLSGNVFFYYFGIQKTTVIASNILYNGGPFLIAIFAHILLNDPISKRKGAAIAIGFLGVLSILLLPLIETGSRPSGNLTGNLLLVIAVLCYSFYTIGSRYLMTAFGYSALTITSVSLYVTCVVSGFLLAVSGEPLPLSPLKNPSILSMLLFVSIMVTTVTYLLYQWAIKLSSPTTASLNTYLQSVFSIALAVILLGEPLTSAFIIGSILVFIGLGLATEQHAQTYMLLRSRGKKRKKT